MNEIIAITKKADEVVITLKEITDILGVRHNDYMVKVKKLAKESSFGTLRETSIVYNDNGQETNTEKVLDYIEL